MNRKLTSLILTTLALICFVCNGTAVNAQNDGDGSSSDPATSSNSNNGTPSGGILPNMTPPSGTPRSGGTINGMTFNEYIGESMKGNAYVSNGVTGIPLCGTSTYSGHGMSGYLGYDTGNCCGPCAGCGHRGCGGWYNRNFGGITRGYGGFGGYSYCGYGDWGVPYSYTACNTPGICNWRSTYHSCCPPVGIMIAPACCGHMGHYSGNVSSGSSITQPDSVVSAQSTTAPTPLNNTATAPVPETTTPPVPTEAPKPNAL